MKRKKYSFGFKSSLSEVLKNADDDMAELVTWMYNQIQDYHRLRWRRVVQHILHSYGGKYVRPTEAGGWSIDPKVLRLFHKATNNQAKFQCRARTWVLPEF